MYLRFFEFIVFIYRSSKQCSALAGPTPPWKGCCPRHTREATAGVDRLTPGCERCTPVLGRTLRGKSGAQLLLTIISTETTTSSPKPLTPSMSLNIILSIIGFSQTNITKDQRLLQRKFFFYHNSRYCPGVPVAASGVIWNRSVATIKLYLPACRCNNLRGVFCHFSFANHFRVH